VFGKARETFGESMLNFLNGNNVTLMIWRPDYAIVLARAGDEHMLKMQLWRIKSHRDIIIIIIFIPSVVKIPRVKNKS